jgi:hypothetical protein
MKEHRFGNLWKLLVSYSMNRRAKEGLKHCDKYFTLSFRRFLLKLLDTSLLIRKSPDTECAYSISRTKKLRLLEETDGSESRNRKLRNLDIETRTQNESPQNPTMRMNPVDA